MSVEATAEVATLPEQTTAPEPAKMRSCLVFGIRFSHMRTKRDGWATDVTYLEGGTKVVSVAVLSLTREELENGKLSGFRLVIGRHSFWAMT